MLHKDRGNTLLKVKPFAVSAVFGKQLTAENKCYSYCCC